MVRIKMAGKSNRRRKQSSSNSSYCSSDYDDDPDYSVKLSQKLFRQEPFTPSKDCKRKNTYDEAKGLQNTENNSTKRAKRRLALPKNDTRRQGEMPFIETAKMVQGKVEPDCLKFRRFNCLRNRSSSSRKNQILGYDIGQGSSTEIKYEQGNNQGNYGSRKRNQCNESEKRKKKATIFSWLIDSETIEENEGVFYMDEYNKRIIKEGKVRREGILCTCCHKIFTSANFVVHGGRRSNRPYDLICSKKYQISLLSCMINAWNNPWNCEYRKFNGIQTKGNASDSYDDACIICADGGNLMCCEKCNSTYHQVCVDLEAVPGGSWYCPYCICKFCIDPARENDYLLECPQCEKRYHWECHLRREMKIIDLNSIPCAPFCGRSCKEVHDKLEKNLLGVKNELDDGFSWSLIHRMDDDTGIYFDDAYRRTLCHSKLAVALGLVEDCFEPIVDRHTRINVIRSVIYNSGSNFNRLKFKGFYTAVLEKDEEIISVASLRIHGTKLAEMPVIATSHTHRSKGMCKKLMVAIESALRHLNVESLVIPSTSERISNWIEKYGFRLIDYNLNKEIIRHNTLMFHDSIRLQMDLASSHLAKSGRKSCSTRKARTNNRHNWLRFKHKASMASIFDLDLEAPGWNQNPWMNNRDRLPYN